MRGNPLGVAIMLLLPAAMLTGCAPEREAEILPAFGSIDEAYDGVDAVLGCEDNPVGEPTVPMGDGVHLSTEQRLCAEHVQIGLYPDEQSLQQGFELWSDSGQGEIQLVRGRNWLVVDVTHVATGETSTWGIEGLAEDLGGEYTVAG